MRIRLPALAKHQGFHSVLVFGMVGVMATCVHVGIGLFLTGTGLADAFLANSIAFSCAFLVSYLGHYSFSFRSTVDHHLALPRFLIVALLGLSLNQLIVFSVVVLLEHSYVLALALVTTVVPLVTYLFGRFWVFGSPRGSTTARNN